MRKKVVGVVKSDKMQKTISVEVERFVRHPKFGKFLKRYTVFKAHDEHNDAKVGDLVEIAETRPLSKTKRWRLVRILKRVGQKGVESEILPT
jgi:small subunit ribosomal protein S17